MVSLLYATNYIVWYMLVVINDGNLDKLKLYVMYLGVVKGPDPKRAGL